ncbi:MAG: hypothetical protein V4621_02365 [Pseudomonadota bacterium]
MDDDNAFDWRVDGQQAATIQGVFGTVSARDVIDLHREFVASGVKTLIVPPNFGQAQNVLSRESGTFHLDNPGVPGAKIYTVLNH